MNTLSSPRLRKNSSFYASSPSSKLVGSDWSLEVLRVKQATSVNEVISGLNQIIEILNTIDRPDRIKFYKPDFDTLVKYIKTRPVWDDEILRTTSLISQDYFNLNQFTKLPAAVINEIFQFMTINTFNSVIAVSWDFCEFGCSNEVWMSFYQRRFLLQNPGKMPSITGDIYCEFHRRLADPQIGDKIEVSWRGRFRLDTQDVYQGQAWWVAEIVDKHATQSRYKIRYPGWESKWDEWVSRSRLRWTVEKNELVSIKTGDIVELWCCGANVPGAWLEAKVRRVKNGRYCLNKVLIAGLLWVDRDRLRLVSRGREVVPDSPRSFSSRMFSMIMPSIFTGFNSQPNSPTQNEQQNHNALEKYDSCCIM